jgi:hypothetical protein
MKILSFTAFAALSLAGALSAADSQLLGMAMPDVKFLAGAYPDRLPAAFQQFFLSMFPPIAGAEFRLLLSAPGLDSTRDIHEILFATANPTQTLGVALARGVFNVSDISDFLVSQGQTASEYNGVPVISSADKNVAAAFPDGSLAVIGGPDEVTAALDRMASPTQPDATLVGKVNDLSTTQDVWAASIFRPEVPDDNATVAGIGLAALAKVQQSTMGMKIGATVQWTAQALTDTAQDCTTLASFLRVLSSMTQKNGAPLAGSQIALLVQNVVITSNGTTLTLSVKTPVDQFPHATPPAKLSRKRGAE